MGDPRALAEKIIGMDRYDLIKAVSFFVGEFSNEKAKLERFLDKHEELKAAARLAMPLLRTYDDGKWKEAYDALEKALK